MWEEDLNKQGLQPQHGVYLLAQQVQPVESDFAPERFRGVVWSGGAGTALCIIPRAG